uniref:Rp1 like 1b n=1 Tax=Cyprinus carpio TaxID=7962 RepID=A0A8C2GSD2_CYPCA
MGSHKQRFQCFDTIMDDPSLKPPFPHGHCSSASFRGSSGSTRLEPLEDRGCNLCADHQQARAMASEASGYYSNPWYHFQTHPHSQQYTIRRPTRPEEAPGQVEGHHHYHHHNHRHSRKIVLVKNSDPSVRRTIVLHRRSLRSLVLFMDEVSELMQCVIRKLYTLEGHKIDSVHSLLQCPSILVCVGREPFHPLLLDSFRKNSYDKLPRLNIKSRSSVCSDEKGAKKNVFFGLETKRSVVHPRCDSSNRSARLSISSEKLFPNGLNSLPPGHRGACPQTGENTMDDDIEKRVLVNKDGSLSMEMKVRFRLLHNETLHWSTEVKKSKSSFNESHIVPDDACSLSQCSAESCSEADSVSAGEADETYSTKCYQRHFEEPHCQHCCTHCQKYDIWKNPVPPDQGSVRRIRSSSSSASSRRIVCKKASTDSMRTMSSEEYTEHVVEKATCIQQTFGDTTTEQCTINHCHSRSEVRSMSPKTKSTSTVEDKCENTHVYENDENRPDVISSNLPKDQLSEQITQPVKEEERPVSVVSSSFQMLASLKEDQDDEDVDLPLSISRTSRGQQEDEESKDAEPNPCSTIPCKSPASPAYLSPRPPSTASSLGWSKRSTKLASPEVDDEEGRSEASASPKASSGPNNCECVVTKDIATQGDSESNDQVEDIQPKTDVQDEEKEERALSSMSAKSKTSTKSLSELSASYENENGAECIGANSEIIEERSSSAISMKSITSGKSNKTNVSEVLERNGRAPSAMSIKSQKSDKSRQTEISDNVSEEQISEVRTSSAMSVKSDTSVRSKASDNGFDELATLQDNVEERAVSAVSSKSNISTMSSRSKGPQSVLEGTSEKRIEEKASSIKSGTSNKSGIKEVTNDDQTVERAPSSISIKSNISARSKMTIELSELEDQDRAPSSISIKSDVSYKSKSDISEAASFQERDESLNSVKLNTPESEAAPQVDFEVDQDGTQEKEDVQERASSAISVKSTTSARSRTSETTTTLGEETKERGPSVMSVKSIKSNASLKSNKSKMEEKEIENRAASALSVKSEVSTLLKKSNQSDVEQMEKRPLSAISAKLNGSVRSKRSKMSELAGYEETCKSTEKSPDKEKRAPSALSTKSNNSNKSKKSKVSDMADDILAEDRDDLRSASAMSSKSNVSAKSVKSVVSELFAEELVEALDQTEERAQSALAEQSNQSGVTVSDEAEVAEERALSAMSSKSNASERLKKSSNLKVPTSLLQAAEHQTEERAQSALSARSSISTRSNKSKISDVLTDMQVDVKDQKEERASSALSAKSSISAKSKNSNVSATDKEKGNRMPSAMSGRSDISTKTSISAKSIASQVSEEPAEETDDEESEVKAPSITKSCISVRSNKSNHSDLSAEEEVQNIERPPSAISIISDATADENEITNDGDIQERAPSAVSAKSHSSIRSRGSKVSEIIIDEPDKQNVERAPSSRSLKSDASGRSGPSDPVNGEKEARTESDLSSVSVRSKKSQDSEIIINVEQRASSTASITSKTSARSKRSNISVVAPKEIGKTDTEDVRASSAMSAKSFTSEKSKCSERTVEEDEEASKVVDRTTSSLSAKSNQSITSDATVKSSIVPTKSNASAKSLLSEAEETDRRSTSVVSNASADTKMSEAGVNTKANRSPSKLSAKSNVSTRSKKSIISEVEAHTPTNTEDKELNRDEIPLSNHSEVSQAENSNEYICGAINKPSSPVASSQKDFDHEEVPVSPYVSSIKSKKSAKSKISSVSSVSERVVTPTSTSVSIGVVEDHEADDVSVNSRISASSKTEICGKSDQCSSESPVQITNEATPTAEGRPKNSTSAHSNVSCKSRSKSPHCGSACPTDTIQDRDDVASNKSSKIKYLITSSDSQPSAKISVKLSKSSQTQEICSSSKASGMSVHTEITGQEKAESPDVTHKSQSVCSKCSSTQQKGNISCASSTSAISDSEKSKTKEGNTAEMTDRPKSNIFNSSSHLKVNLQNNLETTVVDERNNKSNTKSTHKDEDNATRLSVTSGNHLSPTPPKSPKKSKKTVILLGSSNYSVLSQTVPSPEPREEYTDHLNAAAERPQSCRSDTNVSEIKSEKSSKCRKRFGSSSSCHKMDDDMSEPSPSCLPNASPTEVVNEWLRKIPLDTTLFDLGDEFHENYDSIEPLCTSHTPSGEDNEHGSLQPSDVTKLETQNEMEGAHVVNTEGDKTATDKKSPEVAEGDRSQRGDEPKMFNSSVLVMKVLLSPKLDRCNSLPEVSPVYGRKLSASVQGLLDCLANLQLLDFGPGDGDGKKEKYQELMSMLKSLWLCDPKDNEKTSVERNKCLDEEFKARSSSGVDVNSGSTGSGKSSINDGIQAQSNPECEGLDTLTKVPEVDETMQVETSETPDLKYDSATLDIAGRVQLTPETKGTIEVKLKDDVPGSEETIRSNDSPRELTETPLSSNKSSGNNPKKEETESDRQEDTSSGSAPKQQRGQLSKRLSQDPDPIWVLNLLNKLEKQFMTHYVNAMTEFKVQWNLDDNEQLDGMIYELQEEVRRRIQLSIDRELRKIQGRAGRPRPPKDTMSRESTIQTEQRRRRLKVMRNQSIDPQPAKSDDDYTMTGTNFSDQRSDDENCPCDTCLKKKTVSKHVLPVEMLNSAPVMIDFDLRRILQMKKSSPTNEKIEKTANEEASNMEVENAGLKAVKEEDEKEGTDKEILPSSAQEIEDEKRESEEGEEDDSASSTYVEYSSEKQSNIQRHSKKDVNEVGEIAEMSVNTLTVQQDEEQEENIETDSDLMAVKESASSSKMNELDEDVANDDSESDDIMQTEATAEHTEEESEQQDKTADDETAEEGQTANTESVEEGETTGEETSEDGQTAEAVAAGEDEIAGCDTAEEGETAEGENAEDGQTAEAKTSRDGETTEDESAEEDETAEDKASEDEQISNAETTAENEQTSEGETGEEGKTGNEDTAEEHETVEEGQIAEDETGEKGVTVNDDTAEEHETAKSETAEEGQNAEDETGEEGETISNDTTEEHETAENETAEDGETDEDKTVEEGKKAKDKTSEDGRTIKAETIGEDEITEDETAGESEALAESISLEGETAEAETVEKSNIDDDETEEKGETADGNTAEGHVMPENESVEDGEAETARASDTDKDNAKECEIAEDEMAENGLTVEIGTARDGDKPAEDEQNAEADAGEGYTADIKTVDDEQTAEAESAEESEIAKDETEAERDTAEWTSVEEKGTDVKRAYEDEDNTDDVGTAGVVSTDEKGTSEAETADEVTTEAETEMSEEKDAVEDGNMAEDKNAVVELTEQTPDHETTGEETDKSQSNDEEDKETVSCEAANEEDVLSNIEDTESHDVLTNLEVIEDETPLKNKGDIVLDSVDDKGKESGKDDDDVEIMANKAGYVANTGESAEAGDEAEDDTEPDIEMGEGKHNRNRLGLHPLLQPKPKDDKPDGATSFNVLVKHNAEFEDGADADGEDSETEEHNHIIDLSSESESKTQRKTAHKTFKMLVHTQVEEEETPEDGSDDAEECSCGEKDQAEKKRKEKGKLSDITEDTSEDQEDQTNETNDDSEVHKWKSSENAIQKQITKSSLESQPGSFDEVHEEQAKNRKV